MPESQAKFRFWWFFFSLKGRVTRVPIVFFVLPFHVVFLAFDIVSRIVPRNTDKILFENPWFIAGVMLFAINILLNWPIFALLVKRLHDFGLTGIIALPCLYPIFITIAAGTWGLLHESHTIRPEFDPGFRIGDYAQYILSTYYIYTSILILASALIVGNRGNNRYGVDLKPSLPTAGNVF